MNISNNYIIFGSNKHTIKYSEIASLPLSNLKTKTRTIMTALLYTFVYLASLYSPIPTSAQVIHQSFEIGEINTVFLNLDAPYEVETWAGNTILTETKVKMENIPPNVLKHFISKGRYEIIESSNSSEIKLSLKELNRRPIRTKSGEAYETIKIRIFVPENCTVKRQEKDNADIGLTGE